MQKRTRTTIPFPPGIVAKKKCRKCRRKATVALRVSGRKKKTLPQRNRRMHYFCKEHGGAVYTNQTIYPTGLDWIDLKKTYIICA